MQSTTPPLLPAPMPVPLIAIDAAPVVSIDAIKAKYLRVVLSKDEYNLYVLTWKDWFDSHPDYTIVEDRLDVETICMETVLQFRTNILRQRHPKADFDIAYNQSSRRLQQARENLAARRDIRIGARDPKNVGRGGSIQIGNMNVAMMAGTVDEKKVLAHQQGTKPQLTNDMDFLDTTVDSATAIAALGVPVGQDDEVIDVEATEAGEA